MRKILLSVCAVLLWAAIACNRSEERSGLLPTPSLWLCPLGRSIRVLAFSPTGIVHYYDQPVIQVDPVFLRESPWSLRLQDAIQVRVYRYQIAPGAVQAVSETPSQPSTEWEYTLYDEGTRRALSIVQDGAQIRCMFAGERGQLAARELR